MQGLRYLLVAIILLTLLSTGCFKHTYTVGRGAPDGEIVYKHWHNHWVFGIIGEENINIEKICPSGHATIHEETTFLNGLVDVLIGIIYSPTTVIVRCDDGSTADVNLNEEQISRLVNDPLFLVMVEDLIPERLAEVQVALQRHQDATSEIHVASTPRNEPGTNAVAYSANAFAGP